MPPESGGISGRLTEDLPLGGLGEQGWLSVTWVCDGTIKSGEEVVAFVRRDKTDRSGVDALLQGSCPAGLRVEG